MTPPLDDAPATGGRRVARELTGVLLIVVGVLTLGAVLATVDWRLVGGLAAVVCIAAGLWLGRDPDDDERE